MNKNIFKSIGAVLAGMILIIVLSVATDILVQPHGIAPAPMLMVALAYRCVYGVLGGYITAILAPDRPMRHVMILGIIGTAASIWGAIANWGLGEHWYAIGVALTALPTVCIGGKLKRDQLKMSV